MAGVGSTLTYVSAFSGLDRGRPRFLGQGAAPTTVRSEGDATLGLERALHALERRLGGGPLRWRTMMACSSAAGGLRMTVHGLAPQMTARAAREAALGAGAVVELATAGELRPEQLRAVLELRPGVVLLAGGVDFGERRVTLRNARRLAALAAKGLSAPVVFAGNRAIAARVGEILEARGLEAHLAENVYPALDRLNLEPARELIQRVFERHIVSAPGMDRVRRLVDGDIVPTPAAVLRAAELLYPVLGDLLVVDVGGATTDLHSVTAGSPEVRERSFEVEPLSKRTVEGDLGVFAGAKRVVEAVGPGRLDAILGFDHRPVLSGLGAVPKTPAEEALVMALAREAVRRALDRHAGAWRESYGAGGRVVFAEGRDLTAVRWVVGTGGPLVRLAGGRELLSAECRGGPPQRLYPPPDARVLIDRHYIMAACGVLARRYPAQALELLLSSLDGARGEEAGRAREKGEDPGRGQRDAPPPPPG
ncbi:MAG: glutamate mutase L [Acetobacteraceae bacterium]|nr:glutamate mutase L [Acetobacteraceae bacterium]